MPPIFSRPITINQQMFFCNNMKNKTPVLCHVAFHKQNCNNKVFMLDDCWRTMTMKRMMLSIYFMVVYTNKVTLLYTMLRCTTNLRATFPRSGGRSPVSFTTIAQDNIEHDGHPGHHQFVLCWKIHCEYNKSFPNSSYACQSTQHTWVAFPLWVRTNQRRRALVFLFPPEPK